MPDIRIKLTLLCIVLLSANAVSEYVLEDLIAMEDNQRAIHNIGDDSRDGVFNAAGEHRQLIRTVRQKKTDNEGGEKQTAEKEKPKEDDDEEKKTLAQQVADGKYGLIQTEIFSDKPERPGIISYEINPEVPKDNVNNYGGLKAEEIWLAENHLLVLGGGGFGEGGGRDEGRKKPVWPPIDNYVAPERQVKIPPNPKVPPPFPVQLRDGGPIEFLRGENGTGGPPPFPPFPGAGFFPPGNFSGVPPPFFPPPGNFSPGNGAPGPYGQLPPPPFPFPPPSLNGSFIPPPPPFLPGGKQSVPFDEDDPSIYYPPPYDFVYPRDNSSIVPAGPLVPGIVLPPPPDFFAPLNDKPALRQRPKATPTKAPPRPTKKPASEKYNYATPARGSTASKPTKRPSVQIITEEPQQHINEVTPFPHSLPANAVVQGWLPIPAPRPFYITRPRKPYTKNVHQQENTTPPPVVIKERRPTSSQIYSDDGYYYDKPKSRPKENVNYTPTKLVNVDHAYNPPPVYNNPIYITSTIPPPQVPYQNQPQTQNGKALKTFYFYEEPHDISTTTIRPPVQANYYSTPVPQSNYYLPVQEQPRYVQNKYELPPLRANIQTSTRAPPVNYFYITEAPPRAVTTSSRRPPVYEYSYTAPGYGTIDAPKVGTPTPLGISHASVNNQIPEDGSYNYYDDYLDHTTPRTPVSSKHQNRYNQDNLNIVKNNLIYTTERPVYRAPSQTKSPPRGYVYSTTQRPVLSTTAAPYSADLQTQNPYYAFFTHHDAGLIDDITKKYFTIFGQKLNNQGTTPLTPTENSYESVTRKPVKYNRVVTSTPPPRIQEYYYSSPSPQNVPAYYDYEYYDSEERINSNNQGINSAQKAQYYDRSSPQSQTPRPPTLEHDTDVNYNTQNLQIDADAEMIDPQKDPRVDPLRQRAEQLQLRNPIGSSLISYSLPGNGGGHFYFLTPQSIQDQEDANAYAAYSQQQQLGPLYYNKRNTQRQQPISSSSSNSQSSSSTRNNQRQNKRRQYNRQNVEAT
ncbi:hypothetical protein LSTR_LSTR005695 [Laodelphax striatellus]|uniref:Uncharacterized protein n=1 Tax=Laodelphax striatellus TaxID=195883 RepID=A0A482X899_LAOST|nr:hypothetical protein LSTR_LSTR005695 [Laodelphax striatellus]